MILSLRHKNNQTLPTIIYTYFPKKRMIVDHFLTLHHEVCHIGLIHNGKTT